LTKHGRLSAGHHGFHPFDSLGLVCLDPLALDQAVATEIAQISLEHRGASFWGQGLLPFSCYFSLLHPMAERAAMSRLQCAVLLDVGRFRLN
jgi:hypothetical protein